MIRPEAFMLLSVGMFLLAIGLVSESKTMTRITSIMAIFLCLLSGLIATLPR